MATSKKGFFGRLFARKPGGTRVGNILRQAAYNNTYGLAGQDMGYGSNYGAMLIGDHTLKKD